MSQNLPAKAGESKYLFPWTHEDQKTIRAAVAPKATESEFKMLLYRCDVLKADPLSGTVHFVKYKDNEPGKIIVGIDAMRAAAQNTGKLRGIRRGAILDEKGKLIGGWAEVERDGWTIPARIEVDLSEYYRASGQWPKMPKSMICKVAEAQALRMAFAEVLGGTYSDDEMPEAPRDVSPKNETGANAPAGDLPPTARDVSPQTDPNPTTPPAREKTSQGNARAGGRGPQPQSPPKAEPAATKAPPAPSGAPSSSTPPQAQSSSESEAVEAEFAEVEEAPDFDPGEFEEKPLTDEELQRVLEYRVGVNSKTCGGKAIHECETVNLEQVERFLRDKIRAGIALDAAGEEFLEVLELYRRGERTAESSDHPGLP